MIKYLSFFIILLGYEIHADEYFIDVADRTVTLGCADDCPPSVGKLIIARPMLVRDIIDASDIQVENCHATLIAPDKILTAAHCAFRWEYGGWKEQAQGDCSKVFGFYLNDGQGHARCSKILDPIEVSRSRKHTHPDSLVIQLDRSFDGFESIVATPLFEDILNDVVQIWGESANQLERRECVIIENSVLTPLAPEGAYIALECDGPIVSGWSGSSVFLAGESIGVVSQAISQTGHHEALFGRNKAVISLNYCAHRFGADRENCRLTEAQFERALYEIYYAAVDLERDWINQFIAMLERNFPQARFEYTVSDRQSLPRTRGFKRVTPDIADKRIPHFVELDFRSFHPKYVRFNAQTQIIGLYGVLTVLEPGIGGRFYLPPIFHYD